ncbi:MAG: hypothetical protein U0791_20990 [Gemmataceae bacterium]
MGLREAAKHDLLTGYAFIRKLLVELDRRFGLHGGLFSSRSRTCPSCSPEKISERESQTPGNGRQAELTLETPAVLFDDLDAIGRLLPPPSVRDRLGVALSAVRGAGLCSLPNRGRACG